MKTTVLKHAALLSALLGLAVLPTAAAQSGTPAKPVQVRLQLKWFPQAQFAGFFVAQAKGYFKAEGLDVQLLPIGDQSPIQTVSTGAADFGTTWITDLLTAREREVLQGIVDGLGDKQVAGRLALSVETVRTHVKNIYRKLQVGSRGELLSRAARGEL